MAETIFENSNMWYHPQIARNEVEYEETMNFRGLLPNETYSVYNVNRVYLFEGAFVNHRRTPGCKYLIYSAKTARLFFADSRYNTLYQTRLCHLPPEVDKAFSLLEDSSVVIRPNSFMHPVRNFLCYFTGEDETQRFHTKMNDIYAQLNSRAFFRITPEVWVYNDSGNVTDSQDLSDYVHAPKSWEFISVTEDVFTAIVYGGRADIFKILVADFDPNLLSTSSSKKVLIGLEMKGIPQILISHIQPFDTNISLQRIERHISDSQYQTPLSQQDYNFDVCLPFHDSIPTASSIVTTYGAHIRSTSGKTLHINKFIVDHYLASLEAHRVTPGTDIEMVESARGSWLAALTTIKCLYVYEMAHYLVRAIHGHTKSTPDLGKDHEWITREMLDGDDKPDLGSIVEVLWLGHRSDLVQFRNGLSIFVTEMLATKAYSASGELFQDDGIPGPDPSSWVFPLRDVDSDFSGSAPNSSRSFPDEKVSSFEFTTSLKGYIVPLKTLECFAVGLPDCKPFTQLDEVAHPVELQKRDQQRQHMNLSPQASLPKSPASTPEVSSLGIFSSSEGMQPVKAKILRRRPDVFYMD